MRLEHRPDRVVPAVRALVAAQLGPAFTEPPPLDLGACMADSAPARPLIFILSPGADPMAALAQLAAEQVGSALACNSPLDMLLQAAMHLQDMPGL